mmetsp:Transcript_1075/g.2029  ORF Transcript_1075/g.2029 Transcript_1075/m.2029 type:complete len:271 (+) Transcript_1075:66-878(+)
MEEIRFGFIGLQSISVNCLSFSRVHAISSHPKNGIRCCSSSSSDSFSRRNVLKQLAILSFSTGLLSSPSSASEVNQISTYKTVRDRKQKFEIQCPSSWFKSDRSDGFVVGEYASTIVCSVNTLPAQITLEDILLTRRSAQISNAISDAQKFIWKLARIDDVATLLLSLRDATASLGGIQVSKASKVEVLDGAQFGAELDSVDVYFDTAIEPRKEGAAMVTRRGRSLVCYVPERDELIVLTFSAPTDLYSTQLEQSIFKSFRLLPRPNTSA